jgi:hypothetical protein
MNNYLILIIIGIIIYILININKYEYFSIAALTCNQVKNTICNTPTGLFYYDESKNDNEITYTETGDLTSTGTNLWEQWFNCCSINPLYTQFFITNQCATVFTYINLLLNRDNDHPQGRYVMAQEIVLNDHYLALFQKINILYSFLTSAYEINNLEDYDDEYVSKSFIDYLTTNTFDLSKEYLYNLLVDENEPTINEKIEHIQDIQRIRRRR